MAPPYVRATARLGLVVFEVRRVDVTQSTNDDAAALLGRPDAAGVAIVAAYQRAGRGRRERAWVAPPHASLLCTTILPHPIPTSALWAVTFWAALAAAEAIEAVAGVRVALQWPNDLLLDGRKCCGILCVSRVAGDVAYVGCGTGINVRRPADVDAALAAIVPPPAFLSDVAPDVTVDDLLAALLGAYERDLAAFGDPASIAERWERRAGLAGTRYRLSIDDAPGPIDVRALRLGPDGALVVRDATGAQRDVALADARVLR